MSVWVHSLSLVVPKQVLEENYPGGTDALMMALSSLPLSPRTCSESDERLVCATFRDEAHLGSARELLREAGLTETSDGDFIDFACVEPTHGPTAPCQWLSWRINEEGRTIAWHADGDEGALWIPSEANAFEPSDTAQQMRLACEDGVETWLDFRTGAVTSQGDIDAHDDVESIDDGCQLDLPDFDLDLETVRRRALPLIVADTLRANGNLYHRLTPSAFGMRVRQPKATYDMILMANEESRLVSCYVTHSLAVPAARRLALAEAIMRANWGLGVGSFDLDFAEGTLRFRTAVDVEGGVLAPTMVNNMIGASLHTMERFHEAFMRVVWGGVAAREAVAEVLGAEVG